jgi:hypothetical protein
MLDFESNVVYNLKKKIYESQIVMTKQNDINMYK